MPPERGQSERYPSRNGCPTWPETVGMTVVDRGISSKTLDFGGCCKQFLHLRAVETWPALQRTPACFQLLQGTEPLARMRPACMLRVYSVPDETLTVDPEMHQHHVRAITIPQRRPEPDH